MWFYNLMLRFCGYDYWQWVKLTTKLMIPTTVSCQHDSFQDTYDKDNPVPKSGYPKIDHVHPFKNQLRLAAFTMLNAGFSNGDQFQLRSQLQFRNQLRRYRSKVNGSLDISKIPDGEVKMALRTRIKDSSDAFNDFTVHAPNAYTGILDTGANWNAVNDPKLCVPGSVKKLEKPIILDGIASWWFKY